MFGRTARTVLSIIAAGAVSMTLLTLPAARAVVAVALPSIEGVGSSLARSGVREVFRRSQAHFGDLAAEVACSYLQKFVASQAASLTSAHTPR